MARPHTIAEVAKRRLAGVQQFDAAVREFIDSWQMSSASQRLACIVEEPAQINRLCDAYLGALAEHLALSQKCPAPAWTERPSRFLTEPHFAGGLESLKPILLAESPLAFRRRLIFISANALSRPHQDDELAAVDE
jgi:hypothetical protein